MSADQSTGSGRDGYTAYMASQRWAVKRLARLEVDGYRCQTCLHDGSQWRLEVHHRTYERLGNEEVSNDLITLCSQCHEAITTVFRQRRYASQPVVVFDNSDRVLQTQTRRPFSNGVAETQVPTYRRFASADAQCQTRRPAE